MIIANHESKLLTNDPSASEPRWLNDHTVMWLKSGDNANTSFIVADLSRGGESYTAGTAPGPVSNLKLVEIGDGNIGFAVTGLANTDGSLYNPKDVKKALSSGRLYSGGFVRHWDEYVGKERQTIWYGTLTKVKTGAQKLERYTFLGAVVNILKGSNIESPIPPFGGTDHFDISPTGIVFVAKDPTLNPATHTKCNCYFTPLPTLTESVASTPKLLATDELQGACTSPVFSPDGSKIAYLAMKKDGYESDKNRIVIVPNVKSSTETLELFKTEDGQGGWDRSPHAIKFHYDGKGLVAQAEELGRGVLFYIPDALGEAAGTSTLEDPIVQVTFKGTVSDWYPAAKDSSQYLVSGNSFIDNSLFYYIDLKNLGPVQEVSSKSKNGSKLGLASSQVSEEWWTGADDLDVHGWLIKPSFFKEGEKYPFAMLVHGGPQGAWTEAWSTRWNPAVFAEQGYVVLCPNPTGSSGYGQEFQDRIKESWGGRPYEDLVAAFKHVEDNLKYVDTSRSVALGASYGGYMMNWIQGQELGRKFKALVTHDGVFSMTSAQLACEELYFPNHDLGGQLWDVPENWAQWDPSRFTANWSTPHLIIHGELDYRLTVAEGLAAFNVLQQRGVESLYLTFPDENHWVLKHENSLVWHTTVIDFINKFVGLPPLSEQQDGEGVPTEKTFMDLSQS